MLQVQKNKLKWVILAFIKRFKLETILKTHSDPEKI